MVKETIDCITSQDGLMGYSGKDDYIKLEIRLQGENILLTQQYMAELFHPTKQNFSLHQKSFFEEGCLNNGTTVMKYLTARTEGVLKRNKGLVYG